MLPRWYTDYKQNVENFVFDWLERNYWKYANEIPLKRFFEATKYGLEWGKRFRGVLAQVGYEIFGWDLEEVLPFAGALEMIHAFSLVHDDMPELDNDTLRRWKLTVWAAYSDWEALLVGDNLMMLGFELLSETKSKFLPRILKLVANSIWMDGMNGWQYMDVWYELYPQNMDLKTLQQIHSKKTWALITAAIVGWALIWGASEDELKLLASYGNYLWMAFQISDDILDVEGSVAQTGKSVGWEKKWYVYFLWLDQAKKSLEEVVKKWLDIAERIWNDKLRWLIEFMLDRKS